MHSSMAKPGRATTMKRPFRIEIVCFVVATYTAYLSCSPTGFVNGGLASRSTAMQRVTMGATKELATIKPPYGWNDEDGTYEVRNEKEDKYWMKPGYLTPNGYPCPPHWHMSTRELQEQELQLAKAEASYMQEMKAKGMTREEIDAKAKMFEFMEDPNKPGMTEKMKFLQQLTALYQGKDSRNMIDLRSKD